MLIAIGTVLKPRGLQGELKIGMTYNHPEVFNELVQVSLKGKTYAVERGSVQNGFAYLRLAGIDSVEKAEQFRNQIGGQKSGKQRKAGLCVSLHLQCAGGAGGLL